MDRKSMILYEDKEIIVCHKTAGIPVQSAKLGQKDMVSILNNDLAERGEHTLVSVVHRLDQPVEGVLVFAKTKKAASELSRQIQQGSMQKRYHAVCCVQNAVYETRFFEEAGEPLEKISLVDYLIRDGRTNASSVGQQGMKDAKRAELVFSVIGTRTIQEKKYVKAEIDLKTGRHHQIRVQMSHAGLPLYGDQKYNAKWQEYQCCREEGEMRNGLGLCAVSLTFQHPTKGKKMTFEVKPYGTAFSLFDSILSGQDR